MTVKLFNARAVAATAGYSIQITLLRFLTKPRRRERLRKDPAHTRARFFLRLLRDFR